MAKKKNIGGIIYFPQKQHQVCYCSKCSTFIDSTILAYLVGNLNSNNMVCSRCVNKMFMENQVAKDKGAEPFSTETSLYVGIKHSCLKQVYESIPFYFINNEKSKKITVKKCPNCNAYFIDTDVYNKNSFYFDKYRLINSQTKKEIVKFKSTTQNLRSKIRTASEVPAHMQWAAKHPYQGGGFSSK